MEPSDSSSAADAVTLRGPFDRPDFARLGCLLVLCVVVALFLAHATKFSHHTTDDAFISFRYARHLATGKGLTYNPPVRVEGYSNLSWILMLTACHRSGVDPLDASKTLGMLLGVLSLPLTFLATWMLVDRRKATWPLFSTCLLAGSSSFALWCVGGLETPLYAVLLLGLAICLQ
ncbi:MAG: hypothetical protein HY815_02260, partial [Candidatus Riflebacteria bacterium]|nr:hypothetical protein [Candidatus Riflebacteria bacterium]